MALALILRNSTRIPVFSNILKASTVKVKPRRWFTQFSNAPKTKYPILSLSLVKVDNPLKRFMSENHAKFWPIEKLVTVLMLAVVPATFMYNNEVLDDLFAVLLCLHMHWGLEGCVIDYVRPIIFGAVIPKLAIILLYIVTIGTLASLIAYNHNDIGIGCTFQKLWEVTGSLDD